MSRPRHQDIGVAGTVLAGIGARRQATVSSTATISISGTARRSARATARGPRHTTTVASSPSATAHIVGEPTPAARAHADAAMTLFNAIHAKFDTYRRIATIAAPLEPSAGRAAMTDGTRSRDPIGASAATSTAPATLPIAISVIVSAIVNDGAKLAPT